MTGTLFELFLAGIAFAGGHVVLSSSPLRGVIVGTIGENPFRSLFSVLNIALLAWMIWAYGEAPYVELWTAPTGVKHLSFVGVPFASVLVVCGVSTPSPTAVGGEASAAPKARGIVKITRYPMMWGIGLWGAMHLAANGDAAAVMLFGWLTVLALGGTLLIDRKRKRDMGEAWEAFRGETSNLPFQAVIAGKAKVTLKEIGYGRLAAGGALYLLFLFAHEYVISVSPLAP